MTAFTRYAIYVLPQGALYDAGAAWLGWDAVLGQEVAQPVLDDLPRPVAELTATPRKYGFHGTIKPPFRLAEGTTRAALEDAATALLASLAPVELPGLTVRRLGGFVALVPYGPAPDLAALAGAVVKSLDSFRAPPTEAELARRRTSGLNARQEAMLAAWGYPYVLEEFRFHLTLSGRLPEVEADALAARLSDHLAPVLERPYVIDTLALMGEAEDGRFHLIHRYTLAG
jgi:putative phosphonate metabolism protein